MAVIRDMMPAFELFQPASLDDALALLDRYGRRAWVLAGGQDSLDWFKDRIKRPAAVVDLGAIRDLRGIRAIDQGLEIGALTTLAEVAADDVVRSQYRVLADAARQVASPQIRNVGTIGGNVSQDSRCWYYRSGWSCYRAGGNLCYADAPAGMNREHAIFGADRCVTVNPSDTAPALVALDARMVIRTSSGERIVEAERFFMRPAADLTRMTVLEPGELLTLVHVPGVWAGARFFFEKVSDRQSWDFPLVNVAVALAIKHDAIEQARFVINGAAPYPLRLRAVEEAVRGRRPDEETAAMAGALAVGGAAPLRHNEYKVSLVKNLVAKAVRDAEA